MCNSGFILALLLAVRKFGKKRNEVNYGEEKLQNISIIALIISILPFATLIPAFLQIILPDGIRTVWSGINIACVITGLCLSIICVKNNESRSLINIISTIISGLLLLLVSGIIVLALFLTFLQ